MFSYNKRPLIIAEISGNHDGNKKRFLKLIHAAFDNGADLVKIQSYEPEDITLNIKNNKYKIRKGLWKNKYLWDLYKKACTPFSWHKEAFEIAKKNKKTLFSSPFSIRAVDLLESYDVRLYKIASFELTDHRLINYIASKKKPIIISTGMADLKDIKNAIKIIEKFHKKIVILHCVSNYPTKLEDAALVNINYLKSNFGKYFIGLSDHTDNIYSSLAAVPLGVVAIEKHFNLDDKKTTDSDFSINPLQLRELSQTVEKVYKSLNKKFKIRVDKENTNLRRSIFAKTNIKKGEKLNKNNIITLRPVIGVTADNYFKLLGKKAKKNIKKFDPIHYKFLK